MAEAAADPRLQLQLFLKQVYSDLQFIVEHIDPLLKSPNEELSGLVVSAWREVSPRFGEIEQGISQMRPVDLNQRGLTGYQLTLKLTIFRRQSERMRGLVEQKVRGFPVRGFWRNGMRWFFDIIDSILKSIGVPGTDAVGEVKDAIKDAIEV